MDLKIRRLVSSLNDHPLVSSVKLSYYSIDVRFRNGLKEYWVMRGDVKRQMSYEMPKDPGVVSVLPFRREFKISSLDPAYEESKNQFLIKASDCQRAEFVERLIRQDVPVRQKQNPRPPARLLPFFEAAAPIGQVPATLEQLPCDLKRDRRLAGPRRKRE